MIPSLSPRELAELRSSLLQKQAEPAASPEVEQIPVRAGSEVVETRRQRAKCYRLEKGKCGKKTCKCAKGQLHGPYWYAYYRVDGRLKREYVGKAPPGFHPAVKQRSERLRQRAALEIAETRKAIEESRKLRSEARLLVDSVSPTERESRGHCVDR